MKHYTFDQYVGNIVLWATIILAAIKLFGWASYPWWWLGLPSGIVLVVLLLVAAFVPEKR